jgi:membrane associated rhomboid family serine protease
MTTTPVGMRCPDCAGEKTRVRKPIGAPGRPDAPATYVLIAICVAAFVGEIATGGTITAGGGTLTTDGGLFAWLFDPSTQSGVGVAAGEPYRLVTSAFLHAGIIHIGFNMFALYFLGMLLEPAIGTWRFCGIYAVSVLAGSLGALILDPHTLTVGASGGIFGLMSGAFLIARHRGLDELASQIGFFVIINLVFTFSISSISVGAHIGGLLGGAIAAWTVNQLEHRRMANRTAIEAGVLVAMCVLAVVAALIVSNSDVPPNFPG